MTRMTFAIAGILIALTPANGADITVKVVDEAGQGVPSDVLYYDGSQPTPFKLTNDAGIAAIPGACKKIKTFQANPHDTGAYFKSNPVPCSDPAVLHVLSKDTPFGVALKGFEFKTTLPDGTPGVVTIKVGVQSSTTDLEGDKCGVSVRTVVANRTFQTVGVDWVEVKKPQLAKWPLEGFGSDLPEYNVSLPYTCKSAESRIDSLKASAADQVIRNFGIDTAEAYVPPM